MPLLYPGASQSSQTNNFLQNLLPSVGFPEETDISSHNPLSLTEGNTPGLFWHFISRLDLLDLFSQLFDAVRLDQTAARNPVFNLLTIVGHAALDIPSGLRVAQQPRIAAGLSQHRTGEHVAALILGNEGNGLCSQTIESSDYTAIIPMSAGVDSLNVATAAAVAFWQLRKR